MAAVTQGDDRFVTLAGVRFHYRAWGDAGLPPLVLLHGMTETAHRWGYLAPLLADRFWVLALDQRGHGETDWTPTYSIAAMVEDLDAFARALALERFALIGVSMGAINAYLYAARDSRRVERLVIGDFGPPVMERPASAESMLAVRVAADERFADPEEVVTRVMSGNPRLSVGRVREQVHHSLVRADDGRWRWRYDGAKLAGLVATAPSEAVQWASLARVACPTLLVRGARSDVLDRPTAERMVRTIPHCELVEVARSGHAVHTDNPKGFLAAVLPFLTRASAAAC
jgi:pimeloyl-ACP methyl ester carboxylesterase